MNWAHTIKNKALASASLLALCLLVLLSNYIDRNHTNNVKNSISTLYADRLIAEEYILRMTVYMYQIKEVLRSDSNNLHKTQGVEDLLLAFHETNDAYLETKFTELEKTKAAELFHTVKGFDPYQPEENKLNTERADKALDFLSELSEVQLSESKLIMNYSEQLYLSGKTSSQFVFALIIVILVILQTLVFASKSLVSKTTFTDLN